MKSNKGFSLVELIVVIAIMAIIAAVAIPVYSTYITKAETSTNDQIVADVTYAAQLACVEYGVDAAIVADATTGTITLTCASNDVLDQVDVIVSGSKKTAASTTSGTLVWNVEVNKVTGVNNTISKNGVVTAN